MMKVNLISLVLCLPHLLVISVLHFTQEASLSPTEKLTTALDLRLSHTTSETLRPSGSTTETQPGWTEAMFNTHAASLAQIKDSGGTTEEGDLVKSIIFPNPVTSGNTIKGRATVDGTRQEAETRSLHVTNHSEPDQRRTLPGVTTATPPDNSTPEITRELNSPSSTGTLANGTGNSTRLAARLFYESQKDQQTTTDKGLMSVSSATTIENNSREHSSLLTSASSSRTTASNRSKHTSSSSAIAASVPPAHTVTVPGEYENYKAGDNVKEPSNSNKSRTLDTIDQADLLFNQRSFSAQGTRLSNATNYTVYDHIDREHTASPECEETPSSWMQGTSKLACFIILWALAMAASVFLSLSIFLWVRMSVQKGTKRIREGEGRRERASVATLENLWSNQTTSVEERVEFWYANGTTLGHNQQGRERERLRREKWRERERERECDSLWIQPKVTVGDITDFWYAKGRTMPDESTDHSLLETCV
ncbi:hypothetical protein DPEC_G00310230 [Dallia pectoralis]|uniref:Uncharacterized protein n=1 Tax=Dallia pectoralis TaxID=75939 RepID=A0ACC2FF73_DALPE|nr:hypothetical protein DPEC_G00310230 [Dallia pectoralis]